MYGQIERGRQLRRDRLAAVAQDARRGTGERSRRGRSHGDDHLRLNQRDLDQQPRPAGGDIRRARASCGCATCRALPTRSASPRWSRTRRSARCRHAPGRGRAIFRQDRRTVRRRDPPRLQAVHPPASDARVAALPRRRSASPVPRARTRGIASRHDARHRDARHVVRPARPTRPDREWAVPSPCSVGLAPSPRARANRRPTRAADARILDRVSRSHFAMMAIAATRGISTALCKSHYRHL